MGRHHTIDTVVIGLNWVGDNVLALPTYRALQQRYGTEGGIALAAPYHLTSLLSASGLFNRVIGWNGSTRNRIRALREGKFRRAVILPNSFRAAMIAFAAGISERWGYPTDMRGFLLTHQVDREESLGHQLEDYSPLLAALSAPRIGDELPSLVLPTAVREKARKRLRTLGIRLDRPLFGIHAGGLYGPAKHWGDDRYCEVATRLRADGFDVVLLTSPGETAQAESISSACQRLPIIGHDGDVLELAAAISHCSVVITNDSGPLHLATALAVPSISIFGPTDPGRTVIPGLTRVIQKPIGCGPCYQRECPLRHHQCMTAISVDEVYSAAVGLCNEMDTRIAEDGERHVLG